MRTVTSVICDYRPCNGVIPTRNDHCIAGNCDFHVNCWKSLRGAWYRNFQEWDEDVLWEIERLNEDVCGNA